MDRSQFTIPKLFKEEPEKTKCAPCLAQSVPHMTWDSYHHSVPTEGHPSEPIRAAPSVAITGSLTAKCCWAKIWRSRMELAITPTSWPVLNSLSWKGWERVSTVCSSDPEKAELAGTPIIHKRVVSLLVETELQTRARWKGYWRESSLDGSPSRTNPPGARTRSAKCAISPN